MILTAVEIGRAVVSGRDLIKTYSLFDQHMNEFSLLQGADGPITDDNSSSVFRGFRKCRAPMLSCLRRCLLFSNSSLESSRQNHQRTFVSVEADGISVW